MKSACTTKSAERIVPLHDCGKKVCIVNKGRYELNLVKYDGCEVKNQPAADFVVRLDGAVDYILELKGRSIEHALDQIRATVTRLKAAGDLMPEVAAAIHCRQVPKSGRETLKKRESLRKQFGINVSISSSKQHYCIDACSFIDERNA